jgi:hypothetical protein
MWVARVLCIGLAAASVASAAPAGSSPRKAKSTGDPAVVAPPGAEQTPAVRYAAMDRATCEAELTKRKIPFSAAEARGALAPVRLTGPVGGVNFHSSIAPSLRKTSSLEILDCRLVLALDDFAAILRRSDVVEVVHLSGYRAPPRKWPEDKLGKRHQGALAIDVATFVRADGSKLEVERDFHGAIGAKTCGPKAGPRKATPDALALRSIVCDAADSHLFNVELTPDYNRKHKNHFHLEVTPGVNWFLIK